MSDGPDPVVEKLYGTTDAMVWAEEFVRIVKENGIDAADEGFMVGWFANAMATAERHAKSMSDERAEELRTNVFEALGAASMCWDPRPSSAVFESERVRDIVNDLRALLDGAS